MSCAMKQLPEARMFSLRPLATLHRFLVPLPRRVLRRGALRAVPSAMPTSGPVALLVAAVLLAPLPLADNAQATAAQATAAQATTAQATTPRPDTKGKKDTPGRSASTTRTPLTSGQLARLTNEAESGNARARLLLGMLYSDGTDPLVPKDMTRAAHWLQLATQGRDPLPHHLLGLMYFSGQGVPEDKDKARQHMDAALAGGYVASAHFMADMLLSPILPGHDPVEAARWLEKGAILGDARCTYNLGVLHEQGLGVPQDLRRAETLYRQAVSRGYINAMNQLAVLIDSGRASTTDRGEAVRLFRKAAEKGNGLAAYNLGLMLREGRGTGKDWPQAAYWLACADMLGEPRAMKDLPPLLRQLSPEQRKKFNERLVKAPLPPRVRQTGN